MSDVPATLSNFLKLTRVSVWYKMLGVMLIGMAASHSYEPYPSVLLLLVTSLVLSAAFMINDCFDYRADAKNKRRKAIVGKYVSRRFAFFISAMFMLVALATALFMLQKVFTLVLLAALISLWYSIPHGLKNMHVVGLVSATFLDGFFTFVAGYGLFARIGYFAIVMGTYFATLSMCSHVAKDVTEMRYDRMAKVNTFASKFGKGASVALLKTLPPLGIVLMAVAYYAGIVSMPIAALATALSALMFITIVSSSSRYDVVAGRFGVIYLVFGPLFLFVV